MNPRISKPIAVIGWAIIVCTFLLNAWEIFTSVFIVDDYSGHLDSRVSSLASSGGYIYVNVLVAALMFAFGARQVAGVVASAALIGFFAVQSLVFTIVVIAGEHHGSYSDPKEYVPNGLLSVVLCAVVAVGLVMLARAIAPPKTPGYGAPQGFPGQVPGGYQPSGYGPLGGQAPQFPQGGAPQPQGPSTNGGPQQPFPGAPPQFPGR